MKFIIVFLTIIFVANAHAGYKTVTGKITRIQNWEGHGGPLIRMSDMSSTNGLCSRNDSYILPLTHKFFKENFSMLLASKMSDKEVTLFLPDTSCSEGFPRISNMQI